ncbi:MAG: UbiA family prenyltransferase [Chloroflexi bacterium]|nr:UbiA family prenyltransferase [Chloroflexota bacterium]
MLTVSRGSSPIRIGKSFLVFLKAIRFEHTVFALPFAYMTLFLAEGGIPSLRNFVWITLAMVGARTFGMGINRIVDAEIDARNPRTAGWALPAGLMNKSQAFLFSAFALSIFVAATFQLSDISRYFLPVVVAAMVVYPYCKRFTWASHLMLGLVYMMIPPGVWIAVTNQLSLASVVLGTGAGLWVAGFDILYACQDTEVDRQQGIHSMVADFGVSAGLLIARVFHALTVAALAGAGLLLGVGPLYYAGTGALFLLLVYEHHLVSPHDLSRLDKAFFTMNGVVSVVFFVFVAVDSLVKWR